MNVRHPLHGAGLTDARAALMRSSRFALLLLTLVLAPAGHAAPLAPTKPSQLVALLDLGDTCNAGFGRALNVHSQGDGSVAPFAIPDGLVLVVTDWEWCETGNPSGAFVSLSIDGPGGFFPVSSVLREPLTTACTRADLGHGARVSSGAQLCVTPVSANAAVKAHGYLTKDK